MYMTKTCAAFWNHTNLRSGDKIYPCCRFKKPIQSFDGNVSRILHSDEYQKLRTQDVSTMPECAKCMHEESNGKESLRQQFNKEYTQDKIELKYFEVGFDNICDLACDGCWSEWSHTWALKEKPNASLKEVIVSTKDLHSTPSSINKVVFLGGEPLMTNRHRRFLESFDSLDNLEVEYFTNGMHELQEADYSILGQCKRVHFTVSIDGYRDLNEKVRSNSKWDKVLNTLNTIADRFNYTIHTTIHKNNWHGLPKLAEFTKKYANWTTNVLTFPQKLDIIYLTYDEKNELRKILDKYDIPSSEYIRAHINGNME